MLLIKLGFSKVYSLQVSLNMYKWFLILVFIASVHLKQTLKCVFILKEISPLTSISVTEVGYEGSARLYIAFMLMVFIVFSTGFTINVLLFCVFF